MRNRARPDAERRAALRALEVAFSRARFFFNVF